MDRIPRIVNFSIISELQISSNKLHLEINSLENKGNFGPDEIPPIFIKNCMQSLEEPLLRLFNSSLSRGVFPDSWKRNFVQPIFKFGDKHDIKNYRPIAIISTIPKLFDSIVSKRLTDIVLDKIIPEQHSFLQGRSTVTNLITYCTFIHEAFESLMQVDSIYIDFSKAFDSININRLLDKLWNFGITGTLHNWFQSFLLYRKQSVRYADAKSSFVNALSGVPQGSHVGPILFIIYINDFTESPKFANALCYADDVKLFAKITNPFEASKLQRDLTNFESWSHDNGLTINIGKTSVISFYRGRSFIYYDYKLLNNRVDRVNTIRDLGVIFDTTLSFSDHIYARS